MAELTTRTLEVPGAVLAYDVRAGRASDHPPLLIIGSPMGAAGFVTLASHFTDRTVITYDPRGSERSVKADPTSPSTPDEHAGDLHRLIAALDAGAVDLFASSGGAVNALVLVSRHPGQVRTLVAHEPPMAQALPDRVEALAAAVAIHDTYQRSGLGPAMAKFIALVSHQGPIPAGFGSAIGPDPAMFGLPTQDDGLRTDPLVGQNIVTGTHHEPDYEALRSASTRIVIGVGATSGETLACRAARAVAQRLGVEPVTFPGGHDGFLGGEYGGMGEPDAFAARLREVLAS
jgi:pimeloyl-ACP methyl ester carboxylesterase